MSNNATKNYDAILKLLLIGDSGVGKSSCLLRFVGEEFDEQQLATIGVDFRVKFMRVQDKNFKLAVWDTAGQERFRTLTSSYYKGAHGVILMYDVANRESFNNLKMWLNEVQKNCAGAVDPVLCLLGNKIDVRQGASGDFVRTEEGRAFAAEYSMLFVETSAKTSEGIDFAFSELVHKIASGLKLTGTTRQGAVDLNKGPGSPGSQDDDVSTGGICGC